MTSKDNRTDQHYDPLDDIIMEEEAFRDEIATVDAEGKRRWIFPRKPKGIFYERRKWVSYLLLIMLFAGPLLQWNGQPLFLFNLLERKFILFGITFWPQDFHLFVLAMITFFILVVAFTVAFGRIWCGWACPQTIFMEMVFRRIEYWIEGDATQQRKLDKAPWKTDKIIKKTSKWAIFYLLSFLIANLLMAYVIGVEELSKIVTESPQENWGTFTFVMLFSGVFYFVFAWFREQACIVVCPYGRLQGAMLSKESIVVAYDYIRGEPRGKKRKAETDLSLGDCVDCKACVAVCPTGIDIRNGTQLECVNCTACIDACDDIMDRLDRPRGLIRYDSEDGIAEQKAFRFTPRLIAYSVVLVLLFSILTGLMLSRADIETTIIRTPGSMFEVPRPGYISNLYNLQIINKQRDPLPFRLELLDSEGSIQIVGDHQEVDGQGIFKGVIIVELPRDELAGRSHKIRVQVWSGDRPIDRVTTNFLGPITLPK